MANEASAELFLDILTKEEKEALLSKKMEEIRKKNLALRKRHEEIQNDKKAADVTVKTSPTIDSSNNSQTNNRQMNSPTKTNQSFGRGKPRPKSGGDFNHIQDIHIVRSQESRNVQLKDDNDRFQREFRHDTPKRFSFGEEDHPKDFRFGEHDDRDSDRTQNDRRGGRNFRGRGRNDHHNRQDSWKNNEEYHDKRDFRNSGDFSHNTRGRGRGRNDHYNRQNSRNSHEDFHDKRDFRNSGDFSRNDSRGRGGHQRDGNQYNRQGSNNSNEEFHDKRDFRNSGDFSRNDSRGRGGHRDGNQYNRQGSNNSNEEFHDKRDFRNSGDFSRNDSRGRGGHRDGNQYDRQGSRDSNGNRYSGEFKRNNYKEKREQFDDSEFEPTRKRSHGGNHYDDGPEGPPPDPSYNFLSDRTRERNHHQQQDRSDQREGPRRHPKNFGGQDFSNVKNQMKNVKDRQHRSGPPKSKMEMAVTMTGKERRQYIEWKADRDRVDNDRIERQKSSSGEWKREWDKEKFESDNLKETEPTRRPAGRIGSGRFDRGDADERQKGHPEEGSREYSEKGRHHPDSPSKGQNNISPKGRGNRHPETPPRMAGHGRGRGRGKAKSANEAKPQRLRSTSSGDERVVNCDSDLLVIKLENTPGDNSVEVEYSDGEVPVAKTPKGKQRVAGRKAAHGAQTEELWWDEDDDLTMSLLQDGLEGDDALEHRQLFDDADHEIVVGDDEDEWEDCDDDSFYSTEKSQTSTDSREGYHDNQLRVNTQLNPDAPEFTPISPVLSSPRSPKERRSKRQKNDSGKNSRESGQSKIQKDGKSKQDAVQKEKDNSKNKTGKKESDAINGNKDSVKTGKDTKEDTALSKSVKADDKHTKGDTDVSSVVETKETDQTKDTDVSSVVGAKDQEVTQETDVSNSDDTKNKDTSGDTNVSSVIETKETDKTKDTDVSSVVGAKDQEVTQETDVSNSDDTKNKDTPSDTNVSNSVETKGQDTSIGTDVETESQEAPLSNNATVSEENNSPLNGDKCKLDKDPQTKSTNEDLIEAHSETAKDAVNNTGSVVTDNNKSMADSGVEGTTVTGSDVTDNNKSMADSGVEGTTATEDDNKQMAEPETIDKIDKVVQNKDVEELSETEKKGSDE